jgi:hypothetical protein
MAAHVQASVQAVQKKAVLPSARIPPSQPGPAPHVRAAVQAVQAKPAPPRSPVPPPPLPGRVPSPPRPAQPVSGAVQCGKGMKVTARKPVKSPSKKLSRTIQKPTRQRRSRYEEGTHGFKKKEQARLNKKLGRSRLKVSGLTYESEHTIGYAVLVLGANGMKRGKSSEARQVENRAPAYQEVKELHRGHIGTGSGGYDQVVGFSSGSYRDDQRSLLESHDVSSAVQINQLGYAFDPNLRKKSFEEKVEIATNSYDIMVSFMNQVGYIDGEDQKTAPVTPEQKAEMHLARRVAITGLFPTVEEENEARKRFGVKELMEIEEL